MFYKERNFTKDTFREFMFAQSTAHPEMIKMIIAIKKKYRLKIAVVSNEGRELNAYRIQQFNLTGFVDFFISSSFVHFSKPDIDILRVALDIAQVEAKEVVYIGDQPMFISIAESLGIKGIRHIDYKGTCRELASFGLNN